MTIEINAYEWDSMLAKGVLTTSSSDIEKADDWVNAVRVGTKDYKYGRKMYSKKLGRLRDQDILEFYGNAVVD